VVYGKSDHAQLELELNCNEYEFSLIYPNDNFLKFIDVKQQNNKSIIEIQLNRGCVMIIISNKTT
jgi:hypothetical protein